jgi:hypothetical protein
MYCAILITTNELVIAVVGYVMVFLSLLLLYVFFHNLPKLLYINLKREKLKKGKQVEAPDELLVSGEEIAAISTALFLFLDEMHDEESGKLTIKKVSKVYSPWSSKIYAVRNQFNRI